MKKQYILPTVEIVDAETQQMLAASLPLSDTPGIDNEAAILGREDLLDLPLADELTIE